MNRKHSAWCYMLRCGDGSLYTGITFNLADRVNRHNAGRGSKYVRSRLPATLVYIEHMPDWSSALKREGSIKHMSRDDKLALILRTFPTGVPDEHEPSEESKDESRNRPRPSKP